MPSFPIFRSQIKTVDIETNPSSTSEDLSNRDIIIPSPPAHPGPEIVSTSIASTPPASTASTSSTEYSAAGGSQHQIGFEEIEEGEHDQEPLTFSEKFHEMVTENSVVINTFIAGGLAGATSRTVVSPLERLKIILQVQATGKSSAGQAYNKIWPSLVRMWKEEGFAGFMKGNGINVIRILPYSALQFTSYGGFKTFLKNWSGEEYLSTPLRLAAGAGAGIVAVSATYPLDLVRARLSIATSNLAVKGSNASAFSPEDAKLGIMGMTKKVYRTEGGIKGLYRGCWATAVGVAPYVSLNFYIYESLRSYVLPADYEPSSEADLIGRKLACGALAGGTSLLFTHPFDVVRRKLQVAGLSGVGPQYNGAIDCIKHMVKSEGFWKGMYRGLTPNIIKVTPSIAVSFYTFETVRDILANWEHVETPQAI